MKKNGKIFGKINIIDFLAVLVVILFAAGMGLRVILADAVKSVNGNEIEFTVRVDNIRDYTAGALEKKGFVFDEKENETVAEITDVQIVPYKEDVIKTDGTRVFAERPDRYTAYVKMKTEGYLKDNSFFNKNDFEISVGKGYTINTKTAFTTGTVVEMDDISGAIEILDK